MKQEMNVTADRIRCSITIREGAVHFLTQIVMA